MTASPGQFGSRMTTPPLHVDPSAMYDDHHVVATAPMVADPLDDAEFAALQSYLRFRAAEMVPHGLEALGAALTDDQLTALKGDRLVVAPDVTGPTHLAVTDARFDRRLDLYDRLIVASAEVVTSPSGGSAKTVRTDR